MPVRNWLGFALLLIKLVVIGLAGALCWRTVGQMGELDTSMARIKAIKALANIQGFIASERGAATLALGDAAELGPLHNVRVETDGAILAAQTRVDALASMDKSSADLVTGTMEVARKLAASRRYCDDQLRRSKTERRAAAPRVVDQMIGVNAEITRLVRGEVDLLSAVDGPAYASSQIAGLAGSLRTIAGEQAGLLQQLVVDARPVGAADKDDFLVYEGQVRQIWAAILASREDSLTSPAVVSAIDNARTGFMDRYVAIKRELIPHFADGAFPLSGREYRARTQATYQPIIALRDAAYDAALASIRLAHDKVRTWIIASVIATILTLIALRVIFVRVNRRLAGLAMHDTLIGLPNRLLLEGRLKQTMERAKRNGDHFALMFLDLDDFKAVNDARGHHAGDQLLIAIARRISDSVRRQDTVARVGGDEFVLVVEIREPQDAAIVAHKLIHAIDQPIEIADHELRVTASIGISIYPSNGTTRHALMTSADTAMYHAKQQGKNNYRFYDATMNADVQDQLAMVEELHVALDRREFELHYQPQFLASAGAVVGAEALLRWRHPERGFVPPEVFIPLAEKSGLMVPIGTWVLDEACRQAARWHALGHGECTVAVNVSPLQFFHAGLVDAVRDALRRHALRPGSLTLEVTEATAMRDAEASAAILNRLAGMDVNISIDHFGAGHASLAYLKRICAAELKIDPALVAALAQDPADTTVLEAIIALGKVMRMNVVAEGVETPMQQAILAGLGCQVLQGRFLGEPLPGELFYAVAGNVEASQNIGLELQ
ncbi:putative bifunctional diguanylate cyclase/phosphodiesterase [Bordetella genomosp. 10]|nr:bifunctional diguanylate cyclase/phosphodiesterase [Bordetella genomosp. 10]